MSRKNADRSRAEMAARNLTYEDQRLGIGVRCRKPAELDAALLLELRAGPRMKWEIREALHEPETYILARLRALRAAHKVKVVGKNLDKRAWALTGWIADPTTPEAKAEIARRRSAPKVAPPPLRSWWLVPDEQFGDAAKAEKLRMETVTGTFPHWSVFTSRTR